MGCGASKTATNVKSSTSEKSISLPPIDAKSKAKTKTPSAKSNGSTDSGIEDSEPIQPRSTKTTATIDQLLVEHHQKSRLGKGETFDIIAAPKPGRLAPLKHAPRFLLEEKQSPSTNEADLQAKIAAKLERASRRRREIEDARRQASSRIGHRNLNKQSDSQAPVTTMGNGTIPNSAFDERHQQLSMLRDQLRRTTSNNSLFNPVHTPRADSVNSGVTDIANLTPRRGAQMITATTASNFKAVYD